MIYHYGEVGGREGGRERARQRQRQREGGGGLGGGEREREGEGGQRDRNGEKEIKCGQSEVIKQFHEKNEKKCGRADTRTEKTKRANASFLSPHCPPCCGSAPPGYSGFNAGCNTGVLATP